MKLQHKIHLAILAVFIPLIATIITISITLRKQAQETFHQEAEGSANFVDFICQQEIKKLAITITTVLNDRPLQTTRLSKQQSV